MIHNYVDALLACGYLCRVIIGIIFAAFFIKRFYLVSQYTSQHNYNSKSRTFRKYIQRLMIVMQGGKLIA